MILNYDLINGAFEFSGALVLFRNCWMLYKDKVVKGVSAWATFYFFSWGIWNLFFYPALGQWMSWAGGICICLAHFTWLLLLGWYKLAEWRERPVAVGNAPQERSTVH